MDCSTPGLPVHHQLPEFTQTHVHRIGDAIQPSHPLSSPHLLLPIPPSIRVFSNESTLCKRWPNYWRLLELVSIESVMPSNHLILCRPLLFPPSIFPSISVFSNESTLRIRWPKYCSFSFSISPSNEYSGLISFRFDWLDLLAVQGTLKSFLQHHSSKASILQCSAFFMVQLSIHTSLLEYGLLAK